MVSRGGDYRTDTPISIGEPDKVTAWPFKEPEKKSAWADKEEPSTPKDMPVRLVDTQREKDIRRTAEIRAQMSAPEVLKLPERLEAARQKWGIPDGAFKSQAIYDRILVFPIDAEHEKETYGNSSIHMTDTMKKREQQDGHRGILLSVGLEAADHVFSHGVELGDIVYTIRNAPHARKVATLVEAGPMYILVMRDGDLTDNESLMERIMSGETRIVDEGGEHSYCFNLEGKKKRAALVRDNW
jgi:hypothetical protein